MKINRILLPLLLGITQIGACQWIVYNPYNTKGIEGTMISSGFVAKNDKLWFGTDQGVACFNSEFSTWTNFNTYNGLTNNFVYQVFEDKEANIWVATNGGGVSKYSGSGWSNYTTADGLSYNVVRAISQSPDGTLWFGTYGHGLCTYKQGTGFKKFASDAIANSYVLSILAVSDDLILIGTLNEGLVVLESGTVQSPQNGNELAGKKVFSILKDHSGKIWIGTDQGARQYVPSTRTISSGPDSLLGKPVYSISENSSGTIVFATNNKIYTLGNGSWSSIVPDNLASSTVFYSAFYDKKGNGWFGSSNQGLFMKSGEQWYNYFHSTGLESIYYLNDMCEDKNHNLWFCAYQKIYRFDGQNWNNIAKNTELQGDYFGKIIADLNGNIWFTSSNKGLYKYDGNKFTVYSRDIYFNGGYIQCLALEPDGKIWAGTSGGGIYRFDGTKWDHFTSQDGLVSDNVQAISFYSDGKVGIISSYGEISNYDGNAWKSDNSFLGNNYIVDMTIDSENNMWMATYNGIVRHNDSENQFYFNDSYQNNYFTFIKADTKGQIWAGRYEYGLVLYSGGNWFTYNTSNGLSSIYLKDILFDSRGRTWVLADNGINMSSSFTRIDEPGSVLPEKPVVYPNPFSASFDIQYSSKTAGFADIHFFSADGRIIKQYDQQKVDPGNNTFHFESDNWPDGILICKIIMAGSSENIKLLKVSTH